MKSSQPLFSFLKTSIELLRLRGSFSLFDRGYTIQFELCGLRRPASQFRRAGDQEKHLLPPAVRQEPNIAVVRRLCARGYVAE